MSVHRRHSAALSLLRRRRLRVAMPSWNDGETSSEDPLTVGDGESSENLDVPETLHDPDFCGIERHSDQTCDHWEELMKYVAFEGANTGRRFLGCGRPGGGVCSIVNWIDPEWPPHLKKCLVRIWELYEEECTARTTGACEAAEKYYKLLKVNEELEKKIIRLQIELGKALSEGPALRHIDLDVQVRELAGQQTALLVAENKKLQKEKEETEKQRDLLKGEKKKLEYYLGDLLTASEVNKQKLMKINEIMDE